MHYVADLLPLHLRVSKIGSNLDWGRGYYSDIISHMCATKSQRISYLFYRKQADQDEL